MSSHLKARVVRGVGWSAVQTWGSRLSSFIVFPVLARILGPETYGLVALAGVWIMVLEIFSDVSFGAAIEQRRDLEPEHLDSVFWSFLGLGVVLTVGSILGAPLVARFFDEPALTPVVRWLSLGFMLQMSAGVQTSLLRRDLRMGVLAGSALAGNVVGAAVGIAMALTGFGVWSVVAQRLVFRVLNVALVWRLGGWRPGFGFSRRHLRDVAGFGLSVMGNRVLNYLNRQLDQLLIGRFLGKVDLGFYYTASRLYMLIHGMLVGGFSQVSMPALAQLQHDPPRFRRAYVSLARYACLISLPVFVGLHLVAGDLILVLTGPEWRASIPALQVLALVGIVHSVQYVNGAAMLALGRADLRLVIQVVHSVVNVAGFLVAVRYGFVAVAIAYTARAWLLLPLDLLVSRRLGAVSLRALGGAVWPQLMASAVMGAAVWWLGDHLTDGLAPWWRLIVRVAAGAMVYAAVLAAIDRSLWPEVRSLIRDGIGRGRPIDQEHS